MKRNGQNIEYRVTLNIPHLREKINKTCANRPVSCVNGENPSGRMPFGSPFGRAGAERLRGQGRRRRGIGAAIASLCQRDSLSLRSGSRETGLPSPSSLARCHCPGCGSQRLLRCRLHPAGRGPNSSSLFPPLAAVVAVAPKGRGFLRLFAQKTS